MVQPLDLRKIHLGTSGIAAFPLRPQAEGFAVSCGWPRRSVQRAANRFSMFWVVGQCVNSSSDNDGWDWTLLNKEGQPLPFQNIHYCDRSH